MRLLIDAGNTRMKWRLEQAGIVIEEGWSALDSEDPLARVGDYLGSVSRVAVSTVVREDVRLKLLSYLEQKVSAPVRFYWAEAERFGLQNSYADPRAMGADRWHSMYGAWRMYGCGCAVIDAGSAITVDYVSHKGVHLGGYILPGQSMMLKSLKTDAARINFEADAVSVALPGKNTAECVNQGLSWLSLALIEQIRSDSADLGLAEVLVTGGDALRLIALGMDASHYPSLVLHGLGCIDSEDAVV